MQAKLNFIVKCLIVAGMILGLALMIYLTVQIANYPGFPAVAGPGTSPLPVILSYALVVVCFVLAEYIAWTLLSMMRSLSGDPFITANVIALKRMGFAALIIMTLGLMTMLFWAVPLAVVFALPIGMCGLFSLVLSGVFARAVAFKLENDLTV